SGRLRRSATALGRRAVLRLDRAQSAPGKGLRGHHRLGARIPLRRLRHASRPPHRSRLMTFETDSKTFGLTGTSHYAKMVEEARHQRQLIDNVTPDWIVLRNRLSTLGSRNKRFVGEALHELSQRLNFRCIEGLAERVIFREFYPRGLTAVDDLDEITLGTRPSM